VLLLSTGWNEKSFRTAADVEYKTFLGSLATTVGLQGSTTHMATFALAAMRAHGHMEITSVKMLMGGSKKSGFFSAGFLNLRVAAASK
jgi:hypothetical protein